MLVAATQAEGLARFGRALADPIRCRLLLALRERPDCPVELADPDQLGISHPRLSNHLACLRDCGLAVAVPEGRRVRYELSDPRLAHAVGDLMGTVLAVNTEAACPDAEDKGCC
ncbi:ArsR/SmtB family transcription factor [Streptomyces sp. NPDC008086]|uniref:ArsR/SmtB family transcription factor n=1 Tax=Streptomyces sp. NPDC008086 TaxID=3364807 RepID=UPI0036E60974